MKINTKDYRPDIDGLRAIAVSLVVIFHAYPLALTGGFVGVDVFFVISGFLITNIIAGDLSRGSFSYRHFYEKRILRIFPALTLVLIACLVVGYFTLLAREFQPLGKHVIGGATYTSNLLLMKEAGYFDSSSEFKPLLHLWSLAIEEQFYLLWPVVLSVAVASKRSLFRVIGFAALLSFGLCLYFTRQSPDGVFFNPATRSWELFVGAFISFLVPTNGQGAGAFEKISARLGMTEMQARDACSVMGLLLIAVSASAFNAAEFFPYWRALLPCLGAGLVILAGRNALINRRVLAMRPVVYLGLISYPLYLWHWPALYFARIVSNHQLDVSIISGALLFSVLAAAATYHGLEKRVRGSSSRALPAVLLLGLLGVGGVGGLVYLANGMPERFPALEAKAKYVGDADWFTQGYNSSAACIQLLDNKFLEYCNIMDAQRQPTVALLGDSTANHFYPGLARRLAALGSAENLVEIGKGGCAALLDMDASRETGLSRCDQTMADALAYVDSQPGIHTVMLSMSGATYMNDSAVAIQNGAEYFRVRSLSEPTLDDPEKIFDTGLRKTLKHLQEKHKKVIFLLSVPALNFKPEDCLNIRPVSIRETIKSSCSLDRSTVDKLNASYRTMALRVLKDFPDVKVWDPYGLVCDDSRCNMVQNGISVYRDQIHLGFYGSNFVADRLPVADLMQQAKPASQ